MHQFTFKLAGVLEQRLSAERQRQRDVATAQHKQLKLQAELDALTAVSRHSAHQLRSGRLSAGALAAHQRFALSMRHKAAALKAQFVEAERELSHAQAALTEAAKQRKVMEKLREREHARWSEAQRKQDTLEAEEVTQQIRLAERAAQFDVQIQRSTAKIFLSLPLILMRTGANMPRGLSMK